MVNYIRSLFCCHDFEMIQNVDVYKYEFSKYPKFTKKIYLCKKCGYVKRVKC